MVTDEREVRFGCGDYTQRDQQFPATPKLGLTVIGDTISNHNTIQVDRSLAVLDELFVPVHHSTSKDREVSTAVRFASHMEGSALKFLESLKEL